MRIPKEPVTFEQAWLEKESLRVAPLVAKLYPSRRMTSARVLARSRKLMPLLGPAELGYRPVLLVSRGAEDKFPVAVVIVVGMRTETQLRQMVDACAADRKMSHVVIYINREMRETLKAIVKSRDSGKRVLVKALPASERVLRERAIESRRRAAVAEREAVQQRKAERQAEREAARAMRAAAHKSRSERHVPELPGLKPIIDEVWRPVGARLDELGEESDLSRQSVSNRFIANLLIWMIENGVFLDDLSSSTHGVSSQVFRVRLRRIRQTGLFAELQRLVEQHEDRGRLDWRSEVLWAKPVVPVRRTNPWYWAVDGHPSDLEEWPLILADEEGADVLALVERLEDEERRR
jgi:vacuolar-type H+-ATPase subunit E/Vma4